MSASVVFGNLPSETRDSDTNQTVGKGSCQSKVVFLLRWVIDVPPRKDVVTTTHYKWT